MFSPMRIAASAAIFIVLGCTPPKTEEAQDDATSSSRPEPVVRELQALFDDEWATRLARDPLFASSMGVSDYNDALPVDSPENHQQFIPDCN